MYKYIYLYIQIIYIYIQIYIYTNSNIMVVNKNGINPGDHPGPRHTRRIKPSRNNI